jgi:hypothetical protein
MKLKSKAVKLLRKVEEHILGEPKRLEMEVWCDKWNGTKAEQKYYPSCGTVACIAGWVAILGGKKIRDDLYFDPSVAEKLLGLNSIESHSLFYLSYWPMKYLNRYEAAETPRAKAKATVARIEHFIKKGE